MTERRLRQIIRETILEEENRIDESAKDAILKGLTALMLTHGVSAGVELFDAAKNMATDSQETTQSQQLELSHTYKGLKGEALIKYVLENGENKEKIPDEDLNDISIALGEYSRPGHSSVGAGRRQRHNQAIRIISKRLEDSGKQTSQMYSFGRSTR
jgi:hypothetical protein